MFGMTTSAAITLDQPIEAVNIDAGGTALVAMVDFQVGEAVAIEQQAHAGSNGIFGWEGEIIAYYKTRGWDATTETVFRQGDHRYITLNLPRQDA